MGTQAYTIETAVAITVTSFAPPTVAVTPTPSFAKAGLAFGKQGIGPGLLNDARNIAVDGNGTLYVSDYEGGRIQAFDSTGKYLSQFKVGDKNTIVEGLATSLKGEVYVSADGYIYGMDGATGKQLSQWSDPSGGEFGDLAMTADGNVASVWYEGRWGVITTLEGHREDLVVFNPQGKVVLRVQSVISSQTGDLALDNFIAVDGKGTFYALSGGTVYKFGPDGKYLNSFGSTGSAPDQFTYPACLAVDGLGRLYVGDSRKVLVFAQDGHFIDSFSTDVTPNQMAIDLKGNVWIVSGEKISEFVMIEN
jgi:sugar lactone lactonase YvrE